MVGAQFWHAHDGGIYVAWYLPLLLLTIYRPNLEDRVALATVAGRLVAGAPQSPKRRPRGYLAGDARGPNVLPAEVVRALADVDDAAGDDRVEPANRAAAWKSSSLSLPG